MKEKGAVAIAFNTRQCVASERGQLHLLWVHSTPLIAALTAKLLIKCLVAQQI